MNVLTDKTNVDECTCSTLIPEDIPGAVLKKDSEKCLKSELEWWLKCRGFRVKKSSTRANLCSRVRQCMLSDSKFTITDPDPGQCHIIQKKNLCIKFNPTTKNRSGNEALFNVEKKYPQSLSTCSTKLLPKDGWNRKKTTNLPPLFNHVMITDHAKSSGKNRFVEKPKEKGYNFLGDGYLYGVTCVRAETFSFVKAKCHRSQRKNDPPHTLHVKMNEDGFVESGTCPCVAGIDGKCNHIFALLYAVDHAKKMKLAEFPLNETCTQKPSEWSKCRTDGVSSDPIMDCSMASSAGINPTLYQATRSDIEYTDGNTLLASLKELPGNFRIYSVLNTDTTETIKTRMGYSVLKGSVLSYQVSLMEANLNVVENIHQVTGTLQLTLDTVPTEPPSFPWNQNYAADISPDIKTSLKLNLSAEETTDLEKMTREQNLSQKWFAERKRRFLD